MRKNETIAERIIAVFLFFILDKQQKIGLLCVLFQNNEYIYSLSITKLIKDTTRFIFEQHHYKKYHK